MAKREKPERQKPTLTVTLEPEQVEQMQQIRKTEGVPVSFQVRTALEAWLKARGSKTVRKTGGKRR